MTIGDQWSQNYTVTPLQQPDQLWRLRALYRFGAGYTDGDDGKPGLACEYPLVQKAKSSGQATGASSSSTVNVYYNGVPAPKEGPATTPSNNGDNNKQTKYKSIDCPTLTDAEIGTPDPAFLQLPGCVICDVTPDADKAPKPQVHTLQVNPKLSRNWVIFSSGVDTMPEGAVPHGHYGAYDIYSKADGRSQRELSDFILFVLEATLESTSSSGGSTGGKGSSQSGGASPLLTIDKAQPQQMLVR